MLPLFQRRTLWWPTPAGWLMGLIGVCMPAGLWCFFGERFLAHSERLPAEALIVEGWIGIEGVQAAKTEFDRGGYRYLITSGGQFHSTWGPQRWNYAEEAREILTRAGVPPDRLIEARAANTEYHRTFEAAAAVSRKLTERGLHFTAVNVFTADVHARRSRLVFAKVLPAGTAVGVIAWTPSDYHAELPWWKSSDRAVDLIKESAGWLFELLLNSGRLSNSPTRSKD